MTPRCCVCASTEIHRDHLCRSDWWRVYRLARKSSADRKAAREEAEHDYFSHVLLDNPPPAIDRLVAMAKAGRHSGRRFYRAPALPVSK